MHKDSFQLKRRYRSYICMCVCMYQWLIFRSAIATNFHLSLSISLCLLFAFLKKFIYCILKGEFRRKERDREMFHPRFLSPRGQTGLLGARLKLGASAMWVEGTVSCCFFRFINNGADSTQTRLLMARRWLRQQLHLVYHNAYVVISTMPLCLFVLIMSDNKIGSQYLCDFSWHKNSVWNKIMKVVFAQGCA